jgi:hypothetical protein
MNAAMQPTDPELIRLKNLWECGGFTQPAARNQFAASIMADFAGILPRIHVPPHVHIEVVLDV